MGDSVADPDDWIGYDQDGIGSSGNQGGILYYDVNGSQPNGVTFIAVLPDKPTLTAADFVVI